MTVSDQPAGAFLANWWQKTLRDALVKMATDVPAIMVGTASLTLSSDAQNPLGRLIGKDETGFPAREQFNTFAAAEMTVRIVLP